MSLTTPDTIRTLQRKLYAKAKQEPAYRFYALYDKVDRADLLGFALPPCAQSFDKPGNRRMPWCEEHRKAVCGKIACTV